MVNRKIHATYTETYDLNTSVGEMSILGIHTPQAESLKRMFKGFFQQYKKYKILGCNLSMQCASNLALDPLQVGMANGQADPRDILNPILFKACTGESLNLLLNMVYNRNLEVDTNVGIFQDDTVVPGSVSQVITDNQNDMKSYYSLLSDDTFRREHPMKGLTVRGLRPMVHKVVTTQPFRWNGVGGNSSIGSPYINTFGNDNVQLFGGISGSGGDGSLFGSNPSVFVSNGITPMPALDTAVEQRITFIDSGEVGLEGTPTLVETEAPAMWYINNVPRVYMGVIILPPSIAVRLYYRMTIVWHVEFYEFRPAFELGTVGDDLEHLAALSDRPAAMANYQNTYFNLYHTPVSEALTMEMSSFDATGLTEVETVNESVR